MKKLHLILTFSIAAVAAAIITTFSASAEETLQYEDFIYTINGSEITIVKYVGSESYVIIPDMIDKRDVTVIDNEAFAGNQDIEYVSFPNKLERIEEKAFQGCSELRSAILPNSLTTLGDYWGQVFAECENLTELVMGDNINEVSGQCFRNTSISEISFNVNEDYINFKYGFPGTDTLSEVYLRQCPNLGIIFVKGTEYYHFSNTELQKKIIEKLSDYPEYQRITEQNSDVTPLETSHAKVTFNTNGGKSQNSSLWTLYGQSVSEEMPPIRDDYEFMGWYTNAEGKGNAWDFVMDKVSSDMTLYAKWRPLQFEVTFDAQGGNCDAATQDYSFGLAMNSLPGPTKTNYQFIGWYTRPEGNGELYTETSIMPRSELKLYACWLQKGKSLTVEYIANGGECDKTKSLVEYNKAISDLPTPKLSGSKFIGWNTMPDGSGDYYTSTTPVKRPNLTLYAVWGIQKYTITLDANGGSVNQSTKSVTYNTKIGSIEQPMRDGYEFLGWYYNDGTKFKPSDKMPSENVTLKAKWRGFEYMILFDARSGKCDIDTKFVCCGEAVGALPVPTRKNYQFKGWYTKAKGKGTLYTDESEMPEKDITLYASWKKVSGYASSVKLEISKVTLGVGQKHTAKAITNPEYTLDKFTWKSSNTKVATVNNQGIITAKAKGSATITVTTSKGKTAKLTVTVKKAVTSIKTSYSKRTLNVGQEVLVKATPTGYAGTLMWSSSNPQIATVDDNGNITAVRKGLAVITVKAYNGVSAQISITVK